MRHCSKIHSPVIFLRSLVVDCTPPSLVKLSAALCGVITGWSVTTPMSDHVPLLRNAVRLPSIIRGHAATALPVSCPATAMTRVSGWSPVCSAIDGRIVPNSVPGMTSGANCVRCNPHRRSISSSICLVRGFIIAEVERMVYSHAIRPVST